MKELFYTLFLSSKYFSLLGVNARNMATGIKVDRASTQISTRQPMLRSKGPEPLLGTFQDVSKPWTFPRTKTRNVAFQTILRNAVRFIVYVYVLGQANSRVSFTICLFEMFDTHWYQANVISKSSVLKKHRFYNTNRLDAIPAKAGV